MLGEWFYLKINKSIPYHTIFNIKSASIDYRMKRPVEFWKQIWELIQVNDFEQPERSNKNSWDSTS